MTYWCLVMNNLGAPISDASFPGYGASNYGNGWYIVGVGDNQNVYASAPGYNNGATYNTDNVDPDEYYFYWYLSQPAPPPPSGGGW